MSIGGSVRVQIDTDPEFVAVQVKDTGLGIPSEDLPFIFERFYRGEKSRNRKLGGAGIGLAVVKALVEAHDGNITVESIVHSGSTFTVKLPN
jgi:two-component system, OmpR family, sensor histidine kinase BaeS